MTAAADKPHLSCEHMLDLLKQMIRIRRFEDKCAELYTQEKIRGFLHLYDGEEAVAVGVIPVLEKRDRIVATYREHGQALVRGVPMTTVMAEGWLEANHMIHAEEVTRIVAEIDAEIAEAVAFAEAGTWEPVEQLPRFVYADSAVNR